MVAAIDLNLYPFHVTDHDDTPSRFTTTRTVVTEVQSSLYDDDDDDDDDDDEYSFEKEVDDGNTNIEMNLSLSNENKKLKKQLSIVLDKCNSLETQVSKLMQAANKESSSIGRSNPKKRKFNDDDDDESPAVQQSSWKRQQPELQLPAAAAAATISSGIRRVYVHTDPSDKTLVVKDEYQWRKYGQKVTRDNPSPRAYYKCSYAPSCPVKKKVQRSLDNDSIVVATYEGEHNHRSAKEEATYALAHECGISPSTQDQRRTFDQSPKFDEVLVEQMAKYLSSNANFTSDLAAAIYSKLLDVDLLNLC